MKKALITFGLCAFIISAGALVSVIGSKGKPGAGQAQAERNVEEPKLNVAVRVLEARDVEDTLYLTGTLFPWEEVTVSSETRGKIESQDFEEGDVVAAGDSIAKINTTTVQANKDQAMAEYRSAVQELERMEKLREEGISSPQDYDKAVMTRDSSRARLRLTEIQLEQSVVTSPIDGIIDRLEKEKGEFVDIGTPLAHIVQVDKVKLLIGLPEREVVHFEPGDKVQLVPDAFPDKVFTGVIHRIATSAELSTRTFITEVELDNREGLLRPGMIARGRFVRQVHREAITAPLFSILSRGDESYVFVEEDGTANLRAVQLGSVRGDAIHVTEGLQHGDRLIVAGHRDLRDGQEVAVKSVE